MEALIQALGTSFSPMNLLFMNLGVAIGIVFGALPGLSGGVAIVLFMPFTFYLDPVVSLSWLLGMYCGGTYGGSITAILINTPGTAASAATAMDGYALAKKGKPVKALMIALVASCIGGLVSTFMLIFISPLLSKIALKFGPAEYFSLAIFGLSIISGVSGKNIFKGLLMGCLGMFVIMIGMDPMDGVQRLTFGNLYLAGGIDMIPALIGLFALSEMFNKAKGIEKIEVTADFNQKDDRLSWEDVKGCMKTIVKSSGIGTVIGALPGTGAAIASFLSYNEAKRVSKHPEEFGSGSIEGIAASEAGNNGVTGATLIPLLSLGVPGDMVTAILVGAFLMQGLTPGPTLFKNDLPLVYGIMISLLAINVFMYIQGRYFVKLFAQVNRIPMQAMIPVLFVLCVVGVFVANNSMFDVKVILIFGALSYVAGKLKLPVTPLLLGIVLGPMAEQNFRRALSLSKGSLWIFITKPISLFFLVLVVATIVLFVRKNRKEDA
ncbi:MAG: C4-dicarboxylate ABC transporter permease [Lachnospiraceae bacterium]|jgi:putative tricarboxylic transport membrane protein|nr:C4-dicarboxylate ABC transporter permease [Lachnospiraceae bacterium]